MSEPELLPCPFCGGEAEISRGLHAYDAFGVRCPSCNVSTGAYYLSGREAAEVWNRRAERTKLRREGRGGGVVSKATDRERREVARRLRENAENHPEMSLTLIAAFADDAMVPEGAEEWMVAPHDAAMRLADLVEPPPQCPHYDGARHWCGIHDAPAIDREALLELAGELDEVQRGMTSGRYMSPRDAARRIREACGEEGL